MYGKDNLPNIKYAICVFIILCGSCSELCAQDSTYIGKFDYNFAVSVGLENKFALLNEKSGNDDGLTYKPNNPAGINVALSWKGTTLSFGYGLNFLRNGKKGKTKSTDFQYHYYGRKIIFDLFFQRYKGFYRDREDDETPNITLPEGEEGKILVFPDIKVKKYGVFGQYVFNGNKFSSSAAFNQKEAQLKSAGSFLLGGGIFIGEVETDSTFILGNRNIKKLESFQIGISAGYSYSWVIKKRYYVSASASAGINLESAGINRFTKDRLEAFPQFFPRIGMGYNADDWSVGVSFVTNQIYLAYDRDSKFNLRSGNVKLTFTKRLQKNPVLSKLLDDQKASFKLF